MGATKNIQNLRELEEAIDKFEVKKANLKKEMVDNCLYLRENLFRIFLNSLFTKKSRHNEKAHRGSSKANDVFQSAIQKVTDHLMNKASSGIDSFLEKIFRKW